MQSCGAFSHLQKLHVHRLSWWVSKAALIWGFERNILRCTQVEVQGLWENGVRHVSWGEPTPYMVLRVMMVWQVMEHLRNNGSQCSNFGRCKWPRGTETRADQVVNTTAGVSWWPEKIGLHLFLDTELGLEPPKAFSGRMCPCTNVGYHTFCRAWTAFGVWPVQTATEPKGT